MATTMYSALVYPQCPAGGNYARPAIPATFAKLFLVSPTWNPFSATAADRTEYWEDTAGPLALDDVLLDAYGLTGVQAQQIATLTAAYQASVQQAVSFTSAGGVTKAYQSDVPSQTVLMQAAQGYGMAGGVPTGFYFVSSDNTQVPFTLADLEGLYAAMLGRGCTAFQHLQVQKAAVRAATTVAEILAVNW